LIGSVGAQRNMNLSKRTVVETLDVAASLEEPVRKAKPARSILALALRLCVVIVFVFAAYFAVRQGVAAYYFSKNDPRDVELAMRWDPQNPQYADALAHLVQFYSEDPDPNRSVRLCATATRLSPNDAHCWADLGSAYDRAGRPNDAIRAFETARRLFPNSPDVNWRLANFYVRANQANDALPLLKNVLAAGGVENKQVFSLVTGAGVDVSDVLSQMIPARAPVLVEYLNFQLASGNLFAAGEVWSNLLKSELHFRVADSFLYFDALLRGREIDTAAAVWRELDARFPAEIRPRISGSNLVTNGDFDYPILNGGFDWRVIPTQGAPVRIIAADKVRPSGLLRIDFDGSRNPEYGAVFQFVQVQPGAYEFSAEARTYGITTDSGPRFQVFDDYDLTKLFVSTPNQVGSSDWSRIKLTFRTGPETRLIVVRIARPASGKFDNKISGTFWVRHVALREQKGAQPTVQ